MQIAEGDVMAGDDVLTAACTNADEDMELDKLAVLIETAPNFVSIGISSDSITGSIGTFVSWIFLEEKVFSFGDDAEAYWCIDNPIEVTFVSKIDVATDTLDGFSVSMFIICCCISTWSPDNLELTFPTPVTSVIPFNNKLDATPIDRGWVFKAELSDSSLLLGEVGELLQDSPVIDLLLEDSMVFLFLERTITTTKNHYINLCQWQIIH